MINYLYFSCILLFISCLSLYHFVRLDAPLFGIPLFFLIVAMGQALFEVFIFVLIAYLLRRWAPRFVYLSFVSLVFIFALLHYTQFTMVRLMDCTILYPIKYLFGSGIDHLIAGLAALNMNATMFVIIIGAFILIPLLGLGFYKLTFWLSASKPLNATLTQVGVCAIAIGCTLFFLDVIAYPFLNRPIYNKYQKTLPLGTTFFPPTSEKIPLPGPLSLARNEEATRRAIDCPPLSHRPNIYFFVIETLPARFSRC